MSSSGNPYAGPQIGCHVPDDAKSPTAAWVDLNKLYIRDPGTPSRPNWAGLDTSGEVPGLILRWIPTAKGDWTAEVNFDIPYINGHEFLELREQLVPAYALRPRSGSARLLGQRQSC